MMQLVGSFLLAQLASGEFSNRRLIIEGKTTAINPYPYVVSLMFCKPAPQGVACASFCSGSLIARDVVLTAGHCVYNSDESAFESPVSSVPISNMFALIGSGDWRELSRSSGARLVKVSRLMNRGYGMNLRFPLDDDVGLVFLSECVDIIPGRIETVQIASNPIFDSPSSDQCKFVTSLGFGRHANVPAELFVHDGKLRVLKGDSIHSHKTCKKAYVDLHSRFAVSHSNDLELDVVESKHLCSGGDTVASLCFGDSGGPVLLDSDNSSSTVVGITSFGPLGECMLSPDYSSRVSSYAGWIRDQISLMGKQCSGTSIESIFSHWPIPQEDAGNNIEKGRCPEWQCAVSGECVAYTSVCDRKNDCADGSDEDDFYCRIAFIRNPFGRKLKTRTGFSFAIHSWGDPVEVEYEFNKLITVAFSDEDRVMLSSTGQAGYGSRKNSNPSELQVFIVGMLNSVSKQVRGTVERSKKRKRADEASSELLLVCPSFLDEVQQRMSICKYDIDHVLSSIDDEVALATNRFETDPSRVLDACSTLSNCLVFPQGTSRSAWFTLLSACLIVVPSPQGLTQLDVDTAAFCGIEIPQFMTLRESKSSYASSFNELFGEHKCAYSGAYRDMFSVVDTKEAEQPSRYGWFLLSFFTMYIVYIN